MRVIQIPWCESSAFLVFQAGIEAHRFVLAHDIPRRFIAKEKSFHDVSHLPYADNKQITNLLFPSKKLERLSISFLKIGTSVLP